MKICFITNTIFTLGGVQRVVSVLASELSKYHEVDILCTREKSEIDREVYNLDSRVNVKINSIINKKNFFTKIYSGIGKKINKYTGLINYLNCEKLIREIYYPKQLRDNYIKYFNDEQYDIIIGVEGYYSLLLSTICNKIESKVIGWQHNSYEAYLKNKGRYYWRQDNLFKYYIPKLDKYLVLTDYDKEKFKDEMDISVHSMNNPRSFKSEEKAFLKNKRFIAAGRFTHQKGFDLLIQSFKKFSDKNEDWELDIIGEGEDLELLKQMINKYNLEERINIRGFTNKIKKRLLSSSVLLLSSRWEGMPMIVLEGMELGLPIISYNISASIQLIDNNYNGILVNKYDVDEFAEAMLKLSNSYELRKKYSKGSIIKSKNFDVEVIAEKWNEIFEEILQK